MNTPSMLGRVPIVPIVLFAVYSFAEFTLSGATIDRHISALLNVLFAFLVPACIVGHLRAARWRWLLAALWLLAVLLIADARGQLVFKDDPFTGMNYEPSAYLWGFAWLSLTVVVSASLATLTKKVLGRRPAP